jgi:hypothetical protein
MSIAPDAQCTCWRSGIMARPDQAISIIPVLPEMARSTRVMTGAPRTMTMKRLAARMKRYPINPSVIS